MTRDRVRELIKRQKAAPRRDHPIRLRLNGQELGRLKEAARGHGMPAATLARLLLLASLEDLERGRRDAT